MALSNLREILVLSPHPDDAELGAGGLISTCCALGVKVSSVVLTSGSTDNNDGRLRISETIAALESLGVSKQNIHVWDFPVRRMHEYRQDALQALIDFRASREVDLCVLPSPQDIHQDHQVVAEEGYRAFKGCTVWGYELPWNNINFRADTFCEMQKEHIAAKQAALELHKSQSERPYMAPDFAVSLARVRGIQIGVELAEGFQNYRTILKN